MENGRRLNISYLLTLALVAMATTATVPTKTDIAENYGTFQEGELDDLSVSVKVTHPEDKIPDDKIKEPKTNDPWAYVTKPHQTSLHDSHHVSRPSNKRHDLQPLTSVPVSRRGRLSRGRHDGRSTDRDVTRSVNDLDSDLPIPEDKEELKDLVQGLQDQLKESQSLQVAARSILNVVQERQDALEEDLSFLKNEISHLHRLQTKDRESVKALKDLVSDNTWGITSLVTSQEHLKKDVHNLKQDKDGRNGTNSQTEEYLALGAKQDGDFQTSIQALQKEMTNLRAEWAEGHQVIAQIQEAIQVQTGNFNPDEHIKRHRHPDQGYDNEPSNRINPHSGTGSVPGLGSAFEGQHNSVEHSLEELTRMEVKLKQDMEDFSQQFSFYDAEISRVYAMFFNLSFQISTLENKILQHQSKHYETNLSELHQSLLNLTHHLYGMEQTHAPAHTSANTTAGHQQDIQLINNIINNHHDRLETLEKTSHEHISMQDQVNDLMNMQMSRMNNSISRFYKSFRDHHIEATDVFDFIEEKFMEFNRRIQTNDDRLLQMEVRVLNGSLIQCEREGQTLVQGKKLEDVGKVAQVLTRRVEGHNDLLDRLDHGMSRIFDDFGKHTKIVDGVLSEMAVISEVVPQVVELQHEVNNLMLHLPTDCAQITEQEKSPQSGSYLIRPEGGSTSADAYCEFDADASWTVIQRRLDGSVSFARDWKDYKFGFGSSAGEFWIGNDNLHHITTQADYGIRIEMWDLQDRFWWAEYNEFQVDGEDDKYRLHISDFNGNATDALRYSNFMTFSTIDQDNDASSTHCARFYTSGWWYKHCHYGNLNGRYTVGVVWFNHDFDEWVQLRKTVMKIRRVVRSEKNNTKQLKSLENETSDSKFIEYYQSNT